MRRKPNQFLIQDSVFIAAYKKALLYSVIIMLVSNKKAKLAVPATTANLGPAFDCMGMALDIWNTVEVEVSEAPQVKVSGEGMFELPCGPANLIYRASARLFEELGCSTPPLLVKCHNEIPLKRGLGSSAAAIVGGLLASNQLMGQPVCSDDLLDLAVELEGHPDNVVPALLGGIHVVVEDQDELITSPVQIVPGLSTVLYIPDGTLSTQEARGILPDTISGKDAVYNIGWSALLV
mgnify:CR=1 FL=1